MYSSWMKKYDEIVKKEDTKVSELDREELEATRERNIGKKIIDKLVIGVDLDCDYIHKSQLSKVLEDYKNAEANEDNAMDFYRDVHKLLDGDAGIKEEDTLEKRIKEKLAEINDALEEEYEKCKGKGTTRTLDMLTYAKEELEELLEEKY